MEPTPTPTPIDWKRAGQKLLDALIGAVASVLVLWLLPFTRPAAPDLLPDAPAAKQAAQGARAAVVLEDVGLLTPAE